MIKKLNGKTDKIGFKKIIKRNQVVIFTLALMLMTAGYMNYTNNQENENTLLAQLGDAQLVSTNVAETETNANIIENNTIEKTVEDEKNEIENKVESEANNEIAENKIEENTVETNNTNIVEENNVQETNANVSDDYFTKTKLERESMYSQMLATYTEILENEKIPSDQKGIAENEIKNINDTKNAIMIVENLLNTKDLKNAVVFINNPSVNVIIKGENLEKEQVAQIQNIVQRELKTEIENIHITTKK